ncbi:MAG TPA: efflux RND transporter permease subunit, partial [Chloroflexota bacterium]
AGPTRLRPILMTTAAMVFAMLPVALKTGEGAEFRAPMAVVVIGGLLTSTLLTLLFIPAVYTIFDDLQRLVLRLLRRRPKGELGDAAGGVSGDLPPRRRTAGEMEPRVGGVHTAVHGPQVASEG